MIFMQVYCLSSKRAYCETDINILTVGTTNPVTFQHYLRCKGGKTLTTKKKKKNFNKKICAPRH